LTLSFQSNLAILENYILTNQLHQYFREVLKVPEDLEDLEVLVFQCVPAVHVVQLAPFILRIFYRFLETNTFTIRHII
jgi:hypothetical protein